jgi:hypothetical protein
MKQKKCKICKIKYVPERQLQQVCSPLCAIEYGNKHLAKNKLEKKKQINREKKDFNWEDKKWLKKTAQDEINRYARLRDNKERGLKCCTCPNNYGKMDGGHFLPTSGYSAIRYNTNQIHQQCVNCNRYNGGRRPEYTEFMINKYGPEYVENLEAMKNIIRPYSIEYYQRLIKIVRRKTKRL